MIKTTAGNATNCEADPACDGVKTVSTVEHTACGNFTNIVERSNMLFVLIFLIYITYSLTSIIICITLLASCHAIFCDLFKEASISFETQSCVLHVCSLTFYFSM